MLTDRNVLRGICLSGIALVFGVQALHYPLGTISRAGPAMFPLLVSGSLLLVGIAMLVRSYFLTPTPMQFNFRNMGLILGSLVAFAVVSRYVDMAAGITLLVFCATLAAPPYSVLRNVQITAGLIAVAFLFQRLFGLQLNLF